NVDAVKVEIEPSALRYRIATKSTAELAAPETSDFTLGTFKIDGGKRPGRVYTFEFTIDEIER
ncbi:MAG: hypothetical protein II622_04585, partial [Thermoguttaceae bacterium]|nr:hypothetical protein [Thermoguttaceae bacterium]